MQNEQRTTRNTTFKRIYLYKSFSQVILQKVQSFDKMYRIYLGKYVAAFAVPLLRYNRCRKPEGTGKIKEKKKKKICHNGTKSNLVCAEFNYIK